ncbi:uncharacterized protein LOC115766346 isoform X2 [Drosophila novamexicana]|uniref:uncharacterized protein LOC115766346 isoform X2 n=1 Tax=Drosophila novamexicana TaxID=47314 RepID=UPI0011E58FD5|nr:uncharacterized protein LOC115766346 isoform X2 [Drosophila novamexicana]
MTDSLAVNNICYDEIVIEVMPKVRELVPEEVGKELEVRVSEILEQAKAFPYKKINVPDRLKQCKIYGLLIDQNKWKNLKKLIKLAWKISSGYNLL